MDHSVFDADETVVESFSRGLACVDRTGEALVDVVVAELLKLFLVTAPESFEHHTVGSLTAFEESQEIEAPVGSRNFAQAPFDRGRKVGKFAIAARRFGWEGRDRAQRVTGVTALESSRHRFFLVLRAAAEHRIEPEAEEGRDHGENDDFDNQLNFEI